MRRIVLLISLVVFGLLGHQIAQGQNRIATIADIAKYGTYITVGDLILDTPTNPVPLADGINQLRYYYISTAFPTLRENAVIWVDGVKVGPLCEFRLLNGSETTPWHISSATIKPIPGTRLDGIYTKNSYGGFHTLIQGLKNLTMDGVSKQYPGVHNMKEGDFLKGRFGFGVTSTGYYGGYHGYSLSVLNGGTMVLRGLEGEHGFSVLRLQGGSYDWTVSISIENMYIHDTGSEGFYIGATHGPPLARIKDIQIKDVIFARTGSESLQVQHLIGNSHIRNITIFSADVGYLKEFQPYQDTGIQLIADGGTTLMENIVVDGWGSNGINCFGSSFTLPNSQTIIRNIVLNNGRGIPIYFHPSCKYDMKWYFNNITIRQPNWEYYINNKFTKPTYLVSAVNGTDTVRMTNIKYDGISALFQNTAKIITSELLKSTPTDIEYVNSGFYEASHKIKKYQRYYAKYLSGQDSLPVQYEAGEIIMDVQDLYPIVFTKCRVKHTANGVRPKNDPVRFMILKWDASGTRNDQLGYIPTGVQYHYPPDDLRVKRDNYYGRNNIGFVESGPTDDEYISIIQQKDSTINLLTNKIIEAIDKLK